MSKIVCDPLDLSSKLSAKDQEFYMVVKDVFKNTDLNTLQHTIPAFHQTKRDDSSPRFVMDPSKFQMMLNLTQFPPDEMEVKTDDNFVGDHIVGAFLRKFPRCYQPDDVEPEKMKSLSKDRVLTIEEQRKVLEAPPKNERFVPNARL